MELPINASPLISMSSDSYANSLGTHVASASSFYSPTDNRPFRAFDGDNSDTSAWICRYVDLSRPYDINGNYIGIDTFYTTVIDGVTISGEWIQLAFPYAFALTSYSYAGRPGSLRNDMPKEIYIAGSNDGITWKLVDYNLINTTNAPTDVTLSKSTSNRIAYSIYRMVITKVFVSRYICVLVRWDMTGIIYSFDYINSGTIVNKVEIKGLGLPSPFTAAPLPSISSDVYTNSLGTYLVSASSVSVPNGPNAYYAFDTNPESFWVCSYESGSPYNSSGLYVGVAGRFFTTLVGTSTISGEWIQLYSPYEFILRSYTYGARPTSSPNQMPKEIYIAGSNNGTTWTLVDYNFISGTNAPAGASFSKTLPTNTAAYSIYRMIISQIFSGAFVCVLIQWDMSGVISTEKSLLNCNGGMGVSEEIYVAEEIVRTRKNTGVGALNYTTNSAGTITNEMQFINGVNVGRIIKTTDGIQLGSSGNRVAIAANNSLVFKRPSQIFDNGGYISVNSGAPSVLGNADNVRRLTIMRCTLSGTGIGSDMPATIVVDTSTTQTVTSMAYLVATWHEVYTKFARIVVNLDSSRRNVRVHQTNARFVSGYITLNTQTINTNYASGTVVTVGSGGYGVRNFEYSLGDTFQKTAYTGVGRIDSTEIHSYLCGRNIIRQNFIHIQPTSTLAINGGRIFFCCMGTLNRGQIVRGMFIIFDASKTDGCQFGLYKANGILVAQSSSTANNSITANMNYIDYTSPYSVDETTVYYTAALITGTTAISMYTLDNYASRNYGNGSGNSDLTGTATTGLGRISQHTTSTYTVLQSDVSSLSTIITGRVMISGLYS